MFGRRTREIIAFRLRLISSWKTAARQKHDRMTSLVGRIETLSKDNYDTWVLQMQAILIKADNWDYVSGEIKRPGLVAGDAQSELALKQWNTADGKAKSDLILAISPSELKQIKNCETSKEIWDKLEGIYRSKGPARKATLLKQLTVHKMEETQDIREHLNTFFDAVDKLADLEVEINNDLLAIMLLYSLPNSFDTFRCAIESRDQLPTPENLRIKILEESDARSNGRGASVVSNKQDALFTNKSQRRVQNSKQQGFYEHKPNNSSNLKCYKCKKRGHKAKDCKTTNTYGQSANFGQNSSLFSTAGTENAFFSQNDKKWCLDSGATSHIVSGVRDFVKIFDLARGKLNLANGSSTEICGTGLAKLNADVGEKNTRRITLKKSLHVPEARTNLLSIGKITENGCHVIFHKNVAMVKRNSDGKNILFADRIGDLYYVRESSSKDSQPSSETAMVSASSADVAQMWHRRLGHLNIQDMKKACKTGTITGFHLPKFQNTIDCDVCCKGKMTRGSFPQQSQRQTTTLELVHTDVCGPMRVPSAGKSTYFVEYIDDHTRWCEVRFIKSKSEVLQVTQEVVALWERQKQGKIRCIQSDNGTEYTNAEFEKFLKENGIRRRLTVPYTPEQNGVSERKNRTLVEMARCMLIQAGLPPMFWAEAVNTANYIRNRCPTKSLGGKTPHEAWFGKAPDVKHFREFGTRVLCLDNRPGKGKLSNKCVDGIFVGYSTESKGYRVWIPERKTVIVSRDVKFLEQNEKKSTLEEVSSDFEDLKQSRIEPHTVDIEITEEPTAVQQEEIPQRLPGRPRIVRNGRRGRPRKQYRVANQQGGVAEEIFLAEVPFQQAMTGPDSEDWQEAVASEIKSIIKNDTWEIVNRPENERTIGSRIVLRNKFKSDGTMERRKARLVAQGFSQQPGIHFNETFAPVARLSSIRILTSLAARLDMQINQFDVACAYLNGDLEETVYMETPKRLSETLEFISETEGNSEIGQKAKKMFNELASSNKVLRLRKALYGLKQAGKSWHTKLDSVLRKMGAKPTSADPCLYYIDDGGALILIAVYVDDIMVATKNPRNIQKFQEQLSREFEVRSLGPAGYCLGLEFSRGGDEISIRQKGYICDILERFGMSDCKPVSTPMEPGTKLMKPEGEPTPEEAKLPYRELIGALTYLSTATRPDISYAVSCLSQFNNCYRRNHWTAAKRVLRYLKGTMNLGLVYRKGNEPLRGHVDADWGSCPNDRKSFTGYAFILGGSPITWDAKKQKTVALSSTEAEYMALSEAAKEAIYLRGMLGELRMETGQIEVFNDNMSASKLAENSVFHARSKHIDMRHHFIRDALKRKELKVLHAATDKMPADVLTKGLVRVRHISCVEMLGLRSM